MGSPAWDMDETLASDTGLPQARGIWDGLRTPKDTPVLMKDGNMVRLRTRRLIAFKEAAMLWPDATGGSFAGVQLHGTRDFTTQAEIRYSRTLWMLRKNTTVA